MSDRVRGMAGRFVETSGRRIHVWTAGEGDPAMLLHGLTDDGSCWVDAAPVFTGRGFRVIAPDARGHGRTGLLVDDDFTTSARVHDTVGVMSALGVDGALIVGHSMGAITAMRLAERHPNLASVVILVDPPLSGGHPDEPRRRGEQFVDWIAQIGSMETGALTDLCRQEHPAWTVAQVDAWVASKHAVDQELFRRTQSGPEESWRTILDAIEVPVLVVAGELRLRSAVDEGAGRWLREHPDIEFIRIPNAGHSVHRDAAGEFSRVVGGFLGAGP